MIKVVLKKQNENIIGFEMEGHALSQSEMNSTTGDVFDMICNSISVLSQSILIGIVEVLKFKANYEVRDGFLNIDLKNLPKQEIEESQVMMKTFELSLESMLISLDQSVGNKKRCKYIKILKEEV